jgi:putative cardiolipin synthase
MLSVLSGLLTGCALPALEGRVDSQALSTTQSQETALGKILRPIVDSYPGKTGIMSLPDALDAFSARILLARTAEKTLDVQYYIWRNDITGTLLLQALHQAADRGVRVRLLLDDNGLSGMDGILTLLDRHPNIEVRLFNPFVVRAPKLFGYLTDFSRLNRRMHNKSFTADNQLTIIGGRNIGDEYFGATDGVLFADLDVLAAGKVVPDVSADFDKYWHSDSAYPIRSLVGSRYDGDNNALALVEKEIIVEQHPNAEKYLDSVRKSGFVTTLLSGKTAFDWSEVTMVSDDPKKALGQAAPEELLSVRLREVLGEPQRALTLVSPYFVPTAAGVEAFADMAKRGVDIRILTNALEATDVPAVHAGYAKRRHALIAAGIHLYEMRLQANSSSPRGLSRIFGGKKLFGSSGSSLHAKTFAVDNERVFVGSFNFDPRSVNLNTELGFVIHNPVLATQMNTMFIARVPENAYEVKLDDQGRLYWIERNDGNITQYHTEPGTGILKRTWVNFLSILPIDWLL